MMEENKVYFVSLGPGQWDMMTVAAFNTLKKADCIFCPGTEKKSRSAALLAEAGLADNVCLYPLPMSKDRTMAYSAYDKVCEEVMSLYASGKNVAIVAEGDAGFYSSTLYMSVKLAAGGVRTAQVAGVPAFIAAAASAGIPVVTQEECLKVYPGTVTCELLQRSLDAGDVVVVMKMSQCAGELRQAISSMQDVEWHYFENVGTPEEFYTCNTAEILARSIPYFSLMIIKRKA